jgi:hypothetical protein
MVSLVSPFFVGTSHGGSAATVGQREQLTFAASETSWLPSIIPVIGTYPNTTRLRD